jgi:hypothetical protein
MSKALKSASVSTAAICAVTYAAMQTLCRWRWLSQAFDFQVNFQKV